MKLGFSAPLNEMLAYATHLPAHILMKIFLYCIFFSNEFIDPLSLLILATAGMSAADTVLQMLFNSLDLNKDGRISGSELILKLNGKN